MTKNDPSKRIAVNIDLRYPDPDRPGRVYHNAGVLVFDPRARVMGFHYTDNYNGPPLDLTQLDYRKGARTFLFRNDERLPLALEHMLISSDEALDADNINHWLEVVRQYDRGGLRLTVRDVLPDPDAARLSFTEKTSAQGRMTLSHNEPLATKHFGLNKDYQFFGRDKHDPELLVLEDEHRNRWHGFMDPIAQDKNGSARLQATVHKTLKAAGFDMQPHRLMRSATGRPVFLSRVPDWFSGNAWFSVRPGDLAPDAKALHALLAQNSANLAHDQRLLAERLVAGLAFNVRDNAHHSLLLAAPGGFHLAPLDRLSPHPEKGAFDFGLPSVRSLESPDGWVALSKASGLPKILISKTVSRLFRAMSQMPLFAATSNVTPSEWQILRQALSHHLPHLARTLPASPKEAVMARPKGASRPGKSTGPTP